MHHRTTIKQKKIISSVITPQSTPILLPKIKVRTSITTHRNNFNKYYITPSLRYKTKQDNPRDIIENYEDQTFIYNNLHNDKFWSWVHPLATLQRKRVTIKNKVSQEINIPLLERFQVYVEAKKNRRLPIIIKELVSNRI